MSIARVIVIFLYFLPYLAQGLVIPRPTEDEEESKGRLLKIPCPFTDCGAIDDLQECPFEERVPTYISMPWGRCPGCYVCPENLTPTEKRQALDELEKLGKNLENLSNQNDMGYDENTPAPGDNLSNNTKHDWDNSSNGENTSSIYMNSNDAATIASYADAETPTLDPKGRGNASQPDSYTTSSSPIITPDTIYPTNATNSSDIGNMTWEQIIESIDGDATNSSSAENSYDYDSEYDNPSSDSYGSEGYPSSSPSSYYPSGSEYDNPSSDSYGSEEYPSSFTSSYDPSGSDYDYYGGKSEGSPSFPSSENNNIHKPNKNENILDLGALFAFTEKLPNDHPLLRLLCPVVDCFESFEGSEDFDCPPETMVNTWIKFGSIKCAGCPKCP